MIGWFPMIARKVGRTHTHTHTHTQYSKIKQFVMNIKANILKFFQILKIMINAAHNFQI